MNVPALKYALSPLVVWAGVSFVLWDCNPARWDMGVRYLAVGLVVVACVAIRGAEVSR